jgi:hypothetical protein
VPSALGDWPGTNPNVETTSTVSKSTIASPARPGNPGPLSIRSKLMERGHEQQPGQRGRGTRLGEKQALPLASGVSAHQLQPWRRWARPEARLPRVSPALMLVCPIGLLEEAVDVFGVDMRRTLFPAPHPRWSLWQTDSKRAALDLLIVDGYVTEKWGSPASLEPLDLGLIGPGRS